MPTWQRKTLLFLCLYELFRLVKNHYNLRGDLREKAYPLSRKYIDNLTGIRFKTQSIYDQIYFHGYRISFVKYYNYLISALFKNSISKRFFSTSFSERLKLTNVNTKLLSYNPDNFNKETKTFIENLLEVKRIDITKTLITDHMLPPDAPCDYFKYFNEPIKCIVVRRDPRDTYILAKEIYKGKVPIPVDSVEDFIWFYKKTIENTFVDDTVDVLNVRFEDLIYEYENTSEKIANFCGVNNQTRPLCNFNPQKSINNTQLYKVYTKYLPDIRKIEEQLPNSLFSFDHYNFSHDSKRKIF